MSILGRILAPFRRQTPTSPEDWLLLPASTVRFPPAHRLALRAQTAGVDMRGTKPGIGSLPVERAEHEDVFSLLVDMRGTKPGIGSLPVERAEHEDVFSLPVDMRAFGEARQVFAALAPSPVESGRREATDLSVTHEEEYPREENRPN